MAGMAGMGPVAYQQATDKAEEGVGLEEAIGLDQYSTDATISMIPRQYPCV